MTRKWNIVIDQSNANYDEGNEIIYITEVLKSNLCDYTDAYILARSEISIVRNNGTEIAFKNCAPLIKFIAKINATTIDEPEDLDLVMPMYNLL